MDCSKSSYGTIFFGANLDIAPKCSYGPNLFTFYKFLYQSMTLCALNYWFLVSVQNLKKSQTYSLMKKKNTMREIFFVKSDNEYQNVRDHVQISSKFVPKKIVPYAAFEQVILVFRPEWVVQSQHMERFFSEQIWTKFVYMVPKCSYGTICLAFYKFCMTLTIEFLISVSKFEKIANLLFNERK